jgi:hypothetical protein
MTGVGFAGERICPQRLLLPRPPFRQQMGSRYRQLTTCVLPPEAKEEVLAALLLELIDQRLNRLWYIAGTSRTFSAPGGTPWDLAISRMISSHLRWVTLS